MDRFSGEVPGDVRKLVSAAVVFAGTWDFFSSPTGRAFFAVVDGLGEVLKDSITLVSATETSAGGGPELILITLSSRGLLNNWWEVTVKPSCRPKIGGSWVVGGKTAELIGDVGMAPERRALLFGWGPGLPPLSRGRLPVRVGGEVSNRGDSMGEVCTGSGLTTLPLPFDFGLVDLVGLASTLSRRRFPRRGDSSAGFPGGGLAGVDDATGLNASIGEDWMILSVAMTRFGLVNTILRGDGSLREREAADTFVSGMLIAGSLTGVRGNATATGSAVLSSEVAFPWDSTGGPQGGSSTGEGSRCAGVGVLPSESNDGRLPN